MELITDLKNYLGKIDVKMNSHFIIINSKNPSIENRFEAEKLIHSLVSIGIPLTLTLKILEIITDHFINNYKNKKLETSEIRKIVRNSLYGLAEVGVDPKQCLIWGDVYLRRYGNPKGPVEIIHRNGEFEKLDYETLQKKIILEVLAEIFNTEKSKILESVHKKELESMGNELMRVISELGIYRIHHRTLLLIAKEIAMQPPHPWFADPNKSFEYIAADLEKANRHLNNIKSYYNQGNFPNSRNSIRECIHHISTAILCYYNEISGCGELSAFYNLSNRIIELHQKKESFLPGSKIQMLKQDIQFCNLTSVDLFDLLKNLKHNLDIIYRDEIIAETIPLLEKYLFICNSLVSGRLHLREELENAINCKDNKLKGQLYENAVKKVFELSNNFIVKKNIKIKTKQFDLIIEHKCKSEGFSEIKKYIYVECKNTDSKIGMEVIEKLGKRIDEASDRFCNTGIIVSANGFTKDAISEAISYLDKGTLIILLKNWDLYEMIEGDIIRELETKINMLFYGKIE